MHRGALQPPLDLRSLRDEIRAPGSPWRRLDVVAETGSTNADLIARAAAGEDIDGAVLIAEHQTAGRGRNGRTWSAAPRAQITMSVGVGAGDVGPEAWGWLPLAAGVAVVDAVADTAGLTVGLKWPNDVLAGPHGSAGKLAGILAEVAAPRPAIVVGLGLNVTLEDDELPTPVATSLLALGVAAPDRDRLVRALLRELARRIGDWRAAAGPDVALTDDYHARSLTIGSRVRAVLPGASEIVGTAESVDSLGRLRIQTERGIVPVSAGDIAHLRPIDDTHSG
jgi:BirA family biotin operon repressor/biotin-[acetyl-CoA-carboxylase] ligase